jgi:hypothetical protein
VFADLMGSQASFIESRRLGESGYSYSFATAKGQLTILWDPSAGTSVSVPVPADCTAYDLMGQELPAGRIALGSSPVYFVKRP